jgi:hypothetical protein
LKGDSVAAGVAVLTPDTEREREAAHDVDERVARDVFAKILEVLEFLRKLSAAGTRRAGQEYEQKERAKAHDG